MLQFPTISFKGTKDIDKYGDLTGDFYDLLYKSFVIPDSFEYRIVSVTKDFAYRPDLIAKTLYGDTSYMDVICKLNGFTDIFTMGEGTKLIVPEASDVYKFYQQEEGINNISGDESSANTSTETSQQKATTSKRKANEQITGESNFRINKDSKIIIY